LRELRCQVDGGTVVLSGAVSSFFLKQMAQAVILRLEQVERVRNLIEVCGPRQELVPR